MSTWRPSPFFDRALLAVVVLEHALLIAAPTNVLAPLDPAWLVHLMLHGHLPYRDFSFEYPPLATLALLVSGIVPRGLALPALAVQATIVEVVMVALVIRPRGANALRRYAVLSLLVFPFLSGGFDAFAMAAVGISTALLAGERAAGWWVAAAGALVKVSPAAAWAWGRSRWRTALVSLGVTVVVGLAPLAIAHHADDTYIGYTLHRGVEVESLPASAAWLEHALTGHASTYAYKFRSWEIHTGSAGTVAFVALGVLGLAFVALRAGRAEPWLASLACIGLVLCAAKVFSPQYVAWGAPLAAVLGGRWFATYTGAAALTIAAFAVGGHGGGFQAIVLARNVVVAAMTVAAVVACTRPAPTPTPPPTAPV